MKKRQPKIFQKIIFCSLLFFIIFSGTNLKAQTPTIKWWYDLHDASFGQTAAGDIDNDGKLELVFGCYRNDSCVYALNSEDGSLLWKYNTHPAGAEGCNDVAPVIYDVDNDGTTEVIVASSCNPITFCFNGPDGSVKWQTPTRGSDSPPSIADIDNDGKPEILHGEFGGYVICINAENGSESWEIPVNTNSWIQTAPTIVDLNMDGQLDFVVASWAFSGDTNYIYAYRGNDHSVLWKHAAEDVIYHGTAVADLDKDNKPELIIGDYSGKLFALNGENGSEYWTYTYAQDYYIGAPASIADLDADGNCEVVFCSWYKMIALSYDGTPLWNYSIPGYATAFRGAALADVNNDNKADVVFATSNGMVIALKGIDGTPLWAADLAAHYGDTLDFDHAPVIADFDADDTLDLFVVGGQATYPDFQNNYGRGYALSIGKGSGPDWLMFQNDIRRQSSLCGNTSISVYEYGANPMTPEVFPNPGHSLITIKTPHADKKNQQLSIFNPRGKLIRKIFPVNTSAVQVQTDAWPAGLYFFQLSNKDGCTAKGKFIVE